MSDETVREVSLSFGFNQDFEKLLHGMLCHICFFFLVEKYDLNVEIFTFYIS